MRDRIIAEKTGIAETRRQVIAARFAHRPIEPVDRQKGEAVHADQLRHSFANPTGNGQVAPTAVPGTQVNLRNPKFEWGADPPLYRGLRERCRNGGGMDAGVVAYSREPRRGELPEHS